MDYEIEKQQRMLDLIAKELNTEFNSYEQKRKESKEELNIDISLYEEIDFNNFSNIINQLSKFDYEILPEWKKKDLIFIITTGLFSALLNDSLFEGFKKYHDTAGRAKNNLIEESGINGHGGEIPDYIAGVFHRLKYGHDILNPFEIDWDKYFVKEVPLIKKVGAWLHHLFQDLFSMEGLPLPGSSYFRDSFQKNFLPLLKNLTGTNMRTDELYRIVLTLKARDIAASSFIELMVLLYSYGTTSKEKNKVLNYRYCYLVIGSAFCNIMFQLNFLEKLGLKQKSMMKNESLNHASISLIMTHLIILFKLMKKIKIQLVKRDEELEENKKTLERNEEILEKVSETLQKNEEITNEFLEKIKKYNIEINDDIKEAIVELDKEFLQQKTQLEIMNKLFLKKE